MQSLNVLLLDAFLRHKWNMWLASGCADRLGVIAVVFLSAHEGLYILWDDQLDLMTERLGLARPIEGSGAGF